MKKNIIFLIMVVFLLIQPSIFAQEAKNAVSVDIAPALFGIPWTILDENLKFGIGLQYERMIHPGFSLGGRFAYGYHKTERPANADPDLIRTLAIYSFSLELHGRYYPNQNIFFIDGMLGYAFAKTTFSNIILKNDQFTDESNFFKTGIKIGWKFNFGRSKGFILETAFGYSLGLGSVDNKKLDNLWAVSNDDYDDPNKFNFYNFLLIGGPKISLNIGYSF